MDNASKALLIAAAVLIVILIIAFGMSVFNSTGDTSGGVEDITKSQEAQAFNAQIMPYVGKNKTAAQVRNLFITIDNLEKRYGESIIFGNTVMVEEIEENRKYNVVITDYDDYGYIEAIMIS